MDTSHCTATVGVGCRINGVVFLYGQNEFLAGVVGYLPDSGTRGRQFGRNPSTATARPSHPAGQRLIGRRPPDFGQVPSAYSIPVSGKVASRAGR